MQVRHKQVPGDRRVAIASEHEIKELQDCCLERQSRSKRDHTTQGMALLLHSLIRHPFSSSRPRKALTLSKNFCLIPRRWHRTTKTTDHLDTKGTKRLLCLFHTGN